MSRYEPMDDDSFEPPEAPRRRSVLPVFVAALALGGFVGLVWYAYQDGVTVEPSGAVPTVHADSAPIKERPADPGGDEVPHQDRLVYQTLGERAGQGDMSRPTFRDTPEEPMARHPAASAAESGTAGHGADRTPAAPATAGAAEPLLGAADHGSASGHGNTPAPEAKMAEAPPPAHGESTATAMLTGPETPASAHGESRPEATTATARERASSGHAGTSGEAGSTTGTAAESGHGAGTMETARGAPAAGAASSGHGSETASHAAGDASGKAPIPPAPAPIPETAAGPSVGHASASQDTVAESMRKGADEAGAMSTGADEAGAHGTAAEPTGAHGTSPAMGAGTAAMGEGSEAATAQGTERAPMESAAAPEMMGDYRVQISAMRSEEGARDVWAASVKRYPELLGPLELTVQRIDLGGKGVFYRVQAGPLTEDGAEKLCRELKRRGQACLVARATSA